MMFELGRELITVFVQPAIDAAGIGLGHRPGLGLQSCPASRAGQSEPQEERVFLRSSETNDL